jgi:hypothetical protein
LIRHETAAGHVERMRGNAQVLGPKSGRVLWYDARDCLGLIKGDDGAEYLFSMGREGHIGVSTPNGLLPGQEPLTGGERVRFVGVEHTFSPSKHAYEIAREAP